MKSMIMNARTAMPATIAAAMMLSLAAFAGEAPKEDATRKPAAEKTEEAAQKSEVCEMQTGSRIRPRKENNCEPTQHVRTWTKGDIETTGESNLAEALRKLDPAFR